MLHKDKETILLFKQIGRMGQPVETELRNSLLHQEKE